MAASDQGLANGTSAYESIEYFSTLPNGSTYRLDAEMYHAEDLDGAMEGLLGSGNLNHFVMQSNDLGGLSDPTSTSSNLLSDDSLAAAAAPASPAGNVPVTDDDIESASRTDGSTGDTVSSAAGDGTDLRGAPQPIEVANLAGGSTPFIAGGDQPTPTNAVPVGDGETAAEEASESEITDDATPPEELQPRDPDAPSGDDVVGEGGANSGEGGSSEGSDPAASEGGIDIGLTSGGGSLANLDVDLQLGDVGAGLEGLVDVGIELDGLVPGTVEEALNDTLETVEDVLAVEDTVEEVLDIADDALETVDDLVDGLVTGDGGIADLDLVPSLDLSSAIDLGGSTDSDAGDRDLTVDVSQNLIDLPLVDTPVEVELDAIEDIVGDVEVDLTLDVPVSLPI